MDLIEEDLNFQNQNYVEGGRGQSDSDSNILVAIRVRPLNNREIGIGDFDIIRIILDPIAMEFENEKKKMLDVYHRSKEQQYAFDKIFLNESQEEIYLQTCKHLIKPVLSGFNATIFAYGPTGTGKTYTMLGNGEVAGLSALTISDMFEVVKKDEEKEFAISISYVEIYNESIRDLLVANPIYLELRDDPIKGMAIAGATEVQVTSTEQVMNLLFSGNKRRTTEATNANLTSSRSHAVFQIVVNSKPKTKNTNIETLTGKLSLIDLAGSERGTVTENRGIRLREGAKINQSLLALANCINALGDKAKKGFFVPYRDSKLTRMLKDSLGGNCKTVMIANVSPASSQFEETINTLKYANRAKNIKTKALANKKIVSYHIAEYKNIINDLRLEIDQLKSKLHEGGGIRALEEKGTPNSECSCFCKRAEEEEEMKKIQAEIFENFQERIQLRRALMELEEQNALNFLEIRKKHSDIQTYLHNVTPLPSKKQLPPELKAVARQIYTLKANTEKNSIKRDLMTLHLSENINVARRIRDNIPKRIRRQDKRDFLELVIKNHILELQNIELEIHLQIQEKSIGDLKGIIENQRRMVEGEGKNTTLNEEPIEANDFLLEDFLYSEDLNPAPEDEQDDLDDMAELADLKEIIEKSQQPSEPYRKREKSLNLDNPRSSNDVGRREEGGRRREDGGGGRKDEEGGKKEEGWRRRDEEGGKRKDEEGVRFRDKSAPKMLNKGLSEEIGGINCSIEEKGGRKGGRKTQLNGNNVNSSQNQGKVKEGMKENKEIFKVKEKNIIFPPNLAIQPNSNPERMEKINPNLPKPKKK